MSSTTSHAYVDKSPSSVSPTDVTKLSSKDVEPLSPYYSEIVTYQTVYNPLDFDGVESLERYCPGGYHPTLIGDEFEQGRYRVVNKLGHGSSSTVWLTRDKAKQRYVALKIVSAEASLTTGEVEILSYLRKNPDDTHPGHAYVHSYLERFWLTSPNGVHLCIVSEVIGGSLAESIESRISRHSTFPITVARAIIAQVTLVLAYIHSREVCHGGILRSQASVRSRMGWCECARILEVESGLRIYSQYYQIDC